MNLVQRFFIVSCFSIFSQSLSKASIILPNKDNQIKSPLFIKISSDSTVEIFEMLCSKDLFHISVTCKKAWNLYQSKTQFIIEGKDSLLEDILRNNYGKFFGNIFNTEIFKEAFKLKLKNFIDKYRNHNNCSKSQRLLSLDNWDIYYKSLFLLKKMNDLETREQFKEIFRSKEKED